MIAEIKGNILKYRAAFRVTLVTFTIAFFSLSRPLSI